jgi:crotonobetainyl-CoA:carnitine CoA-transferase CaiB-like acyl-CoA transferase
MLPLAGVRIIAVEQYGAGPFGSMLLADQGADIVKIENASEGGDFSRRVGPHFFVENDSQFFQSLNRNKRSLTLDLKRPESREVLHRLVAAADAVMDNLRGDQPEKLGLTHAALSEANPRIVCAHLSAYGRTGERAAWPGFDYLMQAETGYLSLTGEPDGPPARCGLSLVDLMTGTMAALALTSALLGARATGIGRDIDVSLFDTALQNLNYLATWHLNAGVDPTREKRSAHPSIVPSQLYRTRDGWIFIMCNKEKFWPALCRKLGRPEWAADERFADGAARLRHRDLLTELIDGELLRRTTAEWLDHFAGEVPAAPVNDVAAALANPFVADAGRIAEYPHPTAGAVRMLAPPFRCPGETLPTRAAPPLGADTAGILESLGYAPGEIDRLREKGAI